MEGAFRRRGDLRLSGRQGEAWCLRYLRGGGVHATESIMVTAIRLGFVWFYPRKVRVVTRRQQDHVSRDGKI
jgi:hypothetical protein